MSTDTESLYGPAREPGKFHRYTAVELFLCERHSEALQTIAETAKERDYWRTIAQEGVGGLPLEGENDER